MSADRAAFKTDVYAPEDLRVSVRDTDATMQIASFLGRLLRDIDPEQNRPLVLIAIGTDRLTGDSLGPLVGSRAGNWRRGCRSTAPWRSRCMPSIWPIPSRRSTRNTGSRWW